MKLFVPFEFIICVVLNILNEVAGQMGMGMGGMGMGGMGMGMGGMGMGGMGMPMGGGGEDAGKNAMILGAVVGGALAIPVVKMMGGRKEVNNKIGRKLGALGRFVGKRRGGKRVGRYLTKYDRPKPKPEDYENDDDEEEEEEEEEEEHHNHMNQHPGLNGQHEFNGQQGINGHPGSHLHPGNLERQESLQRPGAPGHFASSTSTRSISPAQFSHRPGPVLSHHMGSPAHPGEHSNRFIANPRPAVHAPLVHPVHK